jgi:hypothetical protein
MAATLLVSGGVNEMVLTNYYLLFIGIRGGDGRTAFV